MKLILKLNILAVIFFCFGCNEQQKSNDAADSIATGQMPNVVKDKQNTLHLVFGSGDSLLYTFSSDAGKTFGSPALIALVPELAASHTRGPQVAATANGILVTACTASGAVLSYRKEGNGSWWGPTTVNDADTTAKENLMALSSDGDKAFAVWLDLRDGHNRIYGSKSADGGKTWAKNTLVYASPDTTVCECCKPSVVLKENAVYVMFRNWLNGARDMYLSRSTDGGVTFAEAKKLGNGTWKLNGCPMDGGGLVVGADRQPQTVWFRNGTVYTNEPGKEETAVGKGKNCVIELVNGKNVYGWLEDGNVVVVKPQGAKQNLGKGDAPVLEAINNEQVLCVWEKDKQIHKAIVTL